jgi:hypothetical protein
MKTKKENFMNELDDKILKVIKNASNFDYWVSMPENINMVPCDNYSIVYKNQMIKLKRPNNGCDSFEIIMDNKSIGQVKRDLIDDELNKMKKRIIDNLIKNII